MVNFKLVYNFLNFELWSFVFVVCVKKIFLYFWIVFMVVRRFLLLGVGVFFYLDLFGFILLGYIFFVMEYIIVKLSEWYFIKLLDGNNIFFWLLCRVLEFCWCFVIVFVRMFLLLFILYCSRFFIVFE